MWNLSKTILNLGYSIILPILSDREIPVRRFDSRFFEAKNYRFSIQNMDFKTDFECLEYWNLMHFDASYTLKRTNNNNFEIIKRSKMKMSDLNLWNTVQSMEYN